MPPERGLVTHVPALNEEGTVESVVHSVKRLTTPPVWVIDDHATDGAAAETSQAGASVSRLPGQLGA